MKMNLRACMKTSLRLGISTFFWFCIGLAAAAVVLKPEMAGVDFLNLNSESNSRIYQHRINTPIRVSSKDLIVPHGGSYVSA